MQKIAYKQNNIYIVPLNDDTNLIPDDIIELNIRNYIVGKGLLKRFANLKILDISQNPNTVTFLNKDEFLGLNSLKVLNVNNNGLKCLDKNVFDTLPNLIRLNIEYNPLDFSKLDKDIFKKLINLEILSIDKKQMEGLKENVHILDDLVNLKYISIESRNINIRRNNKYYYRL